LHSSSTVPGKQKKQGHDRFLNAPQDSPATLVVLLPERLFFREPCAAERKVPFKPRR
jgi:hypothetical protein